MPDRAPGRRGEHEISALLADIFALHLKTKSFHWHMTGPHIRDCHLMLHEQADHRLQSQ